MESYKLWECHPCSAGIDLGSKSLYVSLNPIYGLLRGTFHPTQSIAMLRSYMRERESIIKERSTFVQRMEKALVKMNLLLHNVIDDITGKTGTQIITAILDGERDPKRQASFRDPHNKITGDRVISSRTDRVKSSAAQAFIATCRKLAILFYNSLAFGSRYIEQGELIYKQKQEAWERRKLINLAKKYSIISLLLRPKLKY